MCLAMKTTKRESQSRKSTLCSSLISGKCKICQMLILSGQSYSFEAQTVREDDFRIYKSATQHNIDVQ